MAPKLSYRKLDALFEAAGASGIRHRANRVLYERRSDSRLATQLQAAASELERAPQFRAVRVELRRLAFAVQPIEISSLAQKSTWPAAVKSQGTTEVAGGI